MINATVKTPASLAFERRICPSDAVMTAGRWADRDNAGEWAGVQVIEKSVRGVISNRLKNANSSDPAKMKHNIDAANLQTVDSAALPADADTLRLGFTVRVLPGFQHPAACNGFSYAQHLAGVMQGYVDATGMRELAKRYAHNIAAGRFLWRNRVGFESLEIRVSHGDQVWTFDGETFEPGDFESGSDVQQLADVIAAALAGGDSALLRVEGFVQLGCGQELYPSQELVDNATKGKVLYSVGGVAAMHSQKIGNALRSIDTWHGMVEELGAIAVEPYGSVTAKGVSARAPATKLDFYNLLDSWMVKGKEPAIEQQHYVAAMLIRGGVFGEKGE
ncbi:TPA: type I-F CRISPR-associated protein Csy3 [Enterobacter hormaechei subsp. xiangfangensis]|nr:type I-F CRISPR-associated protein Csy3 [Enterobacter hormaechei subsp. xiangfangensis]